MFPRQLTFLFSVMALVLLAGVCVSASATLDTDELFELMDKPLPGHTPIVQTPDPSWGKEDPDEARFTVTKTALTTSARPGDTVTYEIRIENTGNVVLHSVVSTEKFLGAGIKAVFLPKEGLLLNADRSQALIEKIAPGETAVLQAQVVIPENTTGQELVNQVTVTTAETGTQTQTSQAAVRVSTATTAPSYGTAQTQTAPGGTRTSSATASVRQAPAPSSPVATSDPMTPSLYLALLLFAATSALVTITIRNLKG